VRPRHRLQHRIARHIAFAVVVSLVVSAVVLVVVRHRSMSRSMEESARTYTELVCLPVANEVETFRSAGHGRLIPQVRRWLRLNSDIIRLQVVHVGGDIYLKADRDSIETFAEWQHPPRIDDPELLEEIQGMDVKARRISPAGLASVYRVVAPVEEELGRRRVSVVAYFSYANLTSELMQMLGVVGVLLIVSLLLANRVSVALAATITRNLERLHAGVRRLQEGHLDERVRVLSGDEIQELAEAFNAMADAQLETIASLREANRELASLDQAKADLLANVSHELKTPLTALRGYLELLASGDLGELPADAIHAIEVCQKNMSRLGIRIEELVQLSDLESRRSTDAALEPVGIGGLLDGSLETLMPRIREKGLTCTLNLATDLPEVRANAEHLERVLLNVLDNAVKFTAPWGTIRVSAEPHLHNDRSGVLVRVADTGVGIPKREVLRIFDRFHQVDHSVRRRYGGMGLGLSLVRNIVEAHRGVVWAESESGRGATFFIWLPLRTGDDSSGTYRAIEVRPETDAGSTSGSGSAGTVGRDG